MPWSPKPLDPITSIYYSDIDDLGFKPFIVSVRSTNISFCFRCFITFKNFEKIYVKRQLFYTSINLPDSCYPFSLVYNALAVNDNSFPMFGSNGC